MIRRILLADANAEVLAALRLVLEQAGLYQSRLNQPLGLQIVGEARDTISLFAQVARCCPDVVLLDTDLPGLLPRRPGGRKSAGQAAGCGSNSDTISAAGSEAPSSLAELVATLRLLCPGVQVIALSSRPNAEKDCLRAGVDAFACKSDPPDGLLGLLTGNLSLDTD